MFTLLDIYPREWKFVSAKTCTLVISWWSSGSNLMLSLLRAQVQSLIEDLRTHKPHSGCTIKTCIPMFIVALFIIIQNWKQPRYSSTGEQLNRLLSILTVECFAAMKKNKVLIHTAARMNQQRIMLREKGQSQKIIFWMMPYILEITKLWK